MRALEDRDAAAITLRDFFLFLFAHLMWVVELLEEFRRVFDAIDAKVQIVDILVAGPHARRFVRRVTAISGQREIRFAANDRRRRSGRLRRRTRGPRANHVESESRNYDGQVNRRSRKVTTQARGGVRHVS